MPLAPDSQAMLLLTSHLALSHQSGLTPLTLKDWNPLARKLRTASLRPRALLGLDAALQSRLELPRPAAERIERLLDRRAALDLELERLAGLGIFPLTRAGADYPARYLQRLKDAAPPVLFYAGEPALLGQPGVGVVGSRNLDQTGRACAEFVGNACGLAGLVLYSGGARGADTISMDAAMANRGAAVGILADSLEKAVRTNPHQAELNRGDLCLVASYSPNAPFSVGAAMGRNRLIYTISDYAIVVASAAEKGGTWSGASEALRNQWLPVFVLEHAAMPEGNRRLLQKGGLPFPYPFPVGYQQLPAWLQDHAGEREQPPTHLGLF